MKMYLISGSMLFISAVFSIGGCSSDYNVIPYEDGINEVNYENRNRQKALAISLEWAHDYCDDRDKYFKVVTRKSDYEKGVLVDKVVEGLDAVSSAALLVSGIPVVSSIIDPVFNIMGSKTSEKLLFKCVDRE